jgi:putative transposase
MKFKKFVKKLLSFLPKDDYPVLNSQLFFSTWLEFVIDQSVTSMRKLFARLKIPKNSPDISTFFKANTKRKSEFIIDIYRYLNNLVRQKNAIKL